MTDNPIKQMRDALAKIADGYLGDQTAEDQFIWAQNTARTALAAASKLDVEKAQVVICPRDEWGVLLFDTDTIAHVIPLHPTDKSEGKP